MKKKSALVPAPTVGEQSVHLPTIERRRIAIRLNGETPLIVHRFEEKAITEMLAKQRGLPHERQKKNPHQDFEASKYKNVKDQDCIPVMTVKKAMIEASTFSDDMTKKQSRGAFMIIGEYAPIDFGEVRLRKDIVRLSGIGRTPDIRFRAEYLDWSVDLVIDFNPRLITPDQMMYLLREAGSSIGICEWRPQKDGNYGCFSVEPLNDKMIDSVTADCKVPRKPYNLPDWVMREINSEADLNAAIAAAKRASGTGTSRGSTTRGRRVAADEAIEVDGVETDASIEVEAAPKRRGRPPGSKNGAAKGRNGHNGHNGVTNGHSDEAH